MRRTNHPSKTQQLLVQSRTPARHRAPSTLTRASRRHRNARDRRKPSPGYDGCGALCTAITPLACDRFGRELQRQLWHFFQIRTTSILEPQRPLTTRIEFALKTAFRNRWTNTGV